MEDSSERSKESDSEEECEYVDIAKIDDMVNASKVMIKLNAIVGVYKTSRYRS